MTYRLSYSFEEIGQSQISLLFEVIQNLFMSKRKKPPDINDIIKFTIIYSGDFITKENMLTKLTCK